MLHLSALDRIKSHRRLPLAATNQTVVKRRLCKRSIECPAGSSPRRKPSPARGNTGFASSSAQGIDRRRKGTALGRLGGIASPAHQLGGGRRAAEVPGVRLHRPALERARDFPAIPASDSRRPGGESELPLSKREQPILPGLRIGGKRQTFVAALRCDGIEAPGVFDGPINSGGSSPMSSNVSSRRAEARRHRLSRQSGKPEKQSSTRRHSRSRSQAHLPPGLFARSEPDWSFDALSNH